MTFLKKIFAFFNASKEQAKNISYQKELDRLDSTTIEDKGFPIKNSFSLAIAKVHRNYRLNRQF